MLRAAGTVQREIAGRHYTPHRQLVLGTGLEPAHLSAKASKTFVSAIPPPERALAAGIFDASSAGASAEYRRSSSSGEWRRRAAPYRGRLTGRVRPPFQIDHPSSILRSSFVDRSSTVHSPFDHGRRHRQTVSARRRGSSHGSGGRLQSSPGASAHGGPSCGLRNPRPATAVSPRSTPGRKRRCRTASRALRPLAT
jgi:hypothetical protein